MDKAKPFPIPKREVWEAFERVKANQGAAGVDGQSIADFEADLSNNLYKLSNRLSSGSYFPPPAKRVDIPRGGARCSRWNQLTCRTHGALSTACQLCGRFSCWQVVAALTVNSAIFFAGILASAAQARRRPVRTGRRR